MNPQMNLPSSGNSINSSRKSDFSSHYKKSFPTRIQIASKETFKPKRSPDACSIESNSQRANTPRELVSLHEIIRPQQDLATQISLPGYYRCGHAKPIECPCCSAAAERNNKASPKKGQERIQQKAEELTKVVFAHSESLKELIEKLTDTTEETRSVIVQFFESKQRELKEMMDRLLGDLENKKTRFLQNVKPEQSIEEAQKKIAVLEGEFEDIDELKLAFNESDDIKTQILEKNQMIQELGDSLLKRANTKAFTKDLERVVKISQKAFDALQFPEFVDPEKYSLVSKLDSTMTPVSSFYCSIVSSKPINFE